MPAIFGKSAERLRGKFKAYEYQNVILPIIVIRRLECVLIAWREAKRAEVQAKRPKLTEKKLDTLVKNLELNPKQSPFSNKTAWTLRTVYEEDPTLLEENFRAYINGFSQNVDAIIEHFNYRATIGQMVKNNRLAPILSQYKELNLARISSRRWRWATSTRSCCGGFQNKAVRKRENISPRVK